MKNKIIVLVSGVLVILLMVLGVTFAMFSYSRTGETSELVLGDIWMKYTETNGIDLSGAMPGDEYTNYFEFTVSGKNTYTKKDIWYDVVLTKGDVPTDKNENNRILDKYLKFKMVEVNEDDTETVIVTDKTYKEIDNKRIHVEKIPKNTTGEYNKTYRIYMVISEDLKVGNTSDSIMTMEKYEDAFASVKVSVTGDFNEKEVSVEYTPESCFEYSLISYENPTVNPIMASQSVEEENELTACINYLKKYISLSDGEDWESFCKGTGTASGKDFQAHLNELKENTGDFYFLGVEMGKLIDLNVVNFTNGKISIEGYDENCGTDVVIPKTIDGYNVTAIDYGFQNKQLTSVVIPNSVTEISKEVFKDNQLTSIEIPDSVTRIKAYTFANNKLQNLAIPDSIIIIDNNAFANNNLKNVTIPASVTSISKSAFANNELIEVEIGNGIQDMDVGIFANNTNLKSITIDKTCSNIRNIPYLGMICGSEYEMYYYPWASSESPYTLPGLTVYGTDGVCDTF